MMKKIILALSVLGLSGGVYAQKQYADKIVAVVGNKVILQSDIGKQFLGAKEDQKAEMPEHVKCAMLREAIAAKILVEQAARDSVIVSIEEVESALDYQIGNILQAGFNGDKAAMETSMGKTMYQIKEEYREIMKDNLTQKQMLQEVVKDVTITPKEVEQFFNSLPESQLINVSATAEVGQIVLKPSVDPEVEKYTKEQTENIRKQIVEEGKAFETMAQIYSEDGGAQNGGLMNVNRKTSNVDTRFLAATFKLQPGEISPVFRSSFGYHIIQMLERNGDDAKIRYMVLMPKYTSADYAKTMERLDSLRVELVASKISFNEAVSKFSNDDDSRQMGGMVRSENGKSVLNVDEIADPQLALEITSLEVGEFSQPQLYVDEHDQTRKGRILYIKSKTAPHQLNMKDDYNLIQEQALSRKKMTYLNTWIKEKKDGYFIKIDPNYLASCEELSLYQ